LTQPVKRKKKNSANEGSLQTVPLYGKSGIDTPWYKGWAHLTEDERDVYRQRSAKSNAAKRLAEEGNGGDPAHPIYVPRLDPNRLMPQFERHHLRSLSMFSGGGGMDLGFDRAGYSHIASYELLDFAADTLRRNRPEWTVYSGVDGDVTRVDWSQYKGKVDVVHGGPPCQPFSTAGHQRGQTDERDMFPQFVRAVEQIEPLAFVAENVPGLSQAKFAQYLQQTVIGPLSKSYNISTFFLTAASFGVPQNRKRIIFVGIRKDVAKQKYEPSRPTHRFDKFEKNARSSTPMATLDLFSTLAQLPETMGVREALGLPDAGVDALSPTLRCTLTGPRHTTSVVSSVAALKVWNSIHVWPNGVAATKDKAQAFAVSNGDYRLSVSECALLQGFPEDWRFEGAVYKTLGQIGNSVAPPMAYAIAVSVLRALTSAS
jgi:DNA (cytosine-5)-methyltransferase 1